MYVFHHEQVGIESIIISVKKLVCELPTLEKPWNIMDQIFTEPFHLWNSHTVIVYKTHFWLNIYFKDIIKYLTLISISVFLLFFAVSQKLDVSADLSILSWHKICFIENINVEFHICS